MEGPLLYISTAITVISLVLLVVKPLWGLMGIFFCRPLVDATWAQTLVGDFKLTEIISSLVPLIIFAQMVFGDSSRRPLRDMPLKWIWLIWCADTAFFSSAIMFDQEWRAGLSVLMRNLNGITGFYMVQAYCRDEKDFVKFCWGMVIAGFFPMATGLYENLTGIHWRVTEGDDGVIRSIGLYHDGITIRWYAQQVILGLLLIYTLGKRSFVITIFCLVYGLIAIFVLRGVYSKSGFFTLGIWLLLWPILRKNFKALVGLASAAVMVGLYFSQQVIDSFGFVFRKELAAVEGTGEVHSTFAGRWDIWEELAKRWQSLDLMSQLFGAGHVATGAHNDYLQTVFHGGVVGLSIYVILLGMVGWAIGRILWKRSDIWAIAALFAYIMWMIDTIGLVPSAYSAYQWFVWGIVGFALRYRQDEKYRQVSVQAPPPELRPFANLLGAS